MKEFMASYIARLHFDLDKRNGDSCHFVFSNMREEVNKAPNHESEVAAHFKQICLYADLTFFAAFESVATYKCPTQNCYYNVDRPSTSESNQPLPREVYIGIPPTLYSNSPTMMTVVHGSVDDTRAQRCQWCAPEVPALHV